MLRKTGLTFSILMLAALLLVMYGNCADTRITLEVESKESIAIAKPSASICSYAATQTLTDDIHVSFIVDMSGSNIRTTFRPGTTQSFPATDLAGERLTAIQGFIDQHPTLKYRIIPFSSQILSNLNCSAGFQSAGASSLVAQNLMQIQTAERSAVPGTAGLQMKETMYSIALSCASDTLSAEPIGTTTPIHYKFFFVTDGEPTDFASLLNMEQTVQDMQLLAMAKKAASFQVIPVFYGAAPSARAIDTLKTIGRAGNWKNTTTPDAPDTPLLVTKVSEINFDRLLSYTIQQQYRITEFNVINLTARIHEGQLKGDSDMDGVVDDLDLAPTRRRSNSSGLLDGICERLGGEGFCERPKTCSTQLSNSSKLSQCDMQALGLSGAGFDEDADGIPDFIEFLVGTNPIVPDEKSDMDNDGASNLVEIHRGTPVNSPNTVPTTRTLQWSRNISTSRDSTICPVNQDFWKIEIDQIPLVPVQPMNESFDMQWANGDVFRLSHGKNENVLFLYYIQQSTNSTHPTRLMRGKVIKVRSDTPLELNIVPTDFKDFGDPARSPIWR